MAETQLRIGFTGVDKTASVMAGISGKLKGLAIAGAGLFSIGKIAQFGAEAVKAYDVQAKAEAALLQSLGGRSNAQIKLIAQAQQLQKTTLFGDEETVRAQALIAAFVKEEDSIAAIIPLVQDMAAAKGMDLASAAELVAKTLGTETNALKRQGVEVTGAAGSTERLISLSNGLAAAFGGQAEAAAKAGAGPLQQMGNALSDMQEDLGGVIMDLLNFSGVTGQLGAGVSSLTGIFNGSSIAIYGMWEGIKLFFKTALMGVDYVADAFGRLWEAFSSGMDFETAFEGYETNPFKRYDGYVKEMEDNISSFANKKWDAEKPIVKVKEEVKATIQEVKALRGLMGDMVLAGSYKSIQAQFGGMIPQVGGGNPVKMNAAAGMFGEAPTFKEMLKAMKDIVKNTSSLDEIEGSV